MDASWMTLTDVDLYELIKQTSSQDSEIQKQLDTNFKEVPV